MTPPPPPPTGSSYDLLPGWGHDRSTPRHTIHTHQASRGCLENNDQHLFHNYRNLFRQNIDSSLEFLETAFCDPRDYAASTNSCSLKLWQEQLHSTAATAAAWCCARASILVSTVYVAIQCLGNMVSFTTRCFSPIKFLSCCAFYCISCFETHRISALVRSASPTCRNSSLTCFLMTRISKN